MLVSTRIPVKLPSKEKDPTTTELRKRCRSEGMGFGQDRGKAVACESRNGEAGRDRRRPATSRGLKTAKTERAAFHPRRLLLIRHRSIPRAASTSRPDAQDSQNVSPSSARLPPMSSNFSRREGVAVIKRNTIRTGEVPKLNSKKPSATSASHAAIAASAIQAGRPLRMSLRRIFTNHQQRAPISQIQAPRHGSPRSAAN